MKFKNSISHQNQPLDHRLFPKYIQEFTKVPVKNDNIIAGEHQPLIESVYDVYKNPHRLDCPDLHPTYFRLETLIGEEHIHFIHDVETLLQCNKYVTSDRIPW